jgi:hypothetical protein
MSKPDAVPPQFPAEDDDPPSKGPSLTLMYSLLGLALAIALALAAFIVLPFYQRR